FSSLSIKYLGDR
ncbi:hypothetical protein D030_5278B, partial [Vibrio parahaemolyticus AQ3810]